MAWGIMMTAVTLVGMLGLLIFGLSQQKPPVRNESAEAIAPAAVGQQRAA
jgi:hypothetical protein